MMVISTTIMIDDLIRKGLDKLCRLFCDLARVVYIFTVTNQMNRRMCILTVMTNRASSGFNLWGLPATLALAPTNCEI
jgi:hypothetical protein